MNSNIKKSLIIIFVVGLVVRLLILITGLSVGGHDFYLNYSDAVGYTRLAGNIFNGNGFSINQAIPFEPNSTRTPLYPLFLALSLLISGNFWVAVAFQTILGAFIPILVYFLLKKLNFSDKISLVVSAFFGIEPFFSAHGVFLLSEVLFIFIFLSSCVLYFHYVAKRRVFFLILSAVFLGLAALTRPIAFYMIFIFLLHMAFIGFRQWRQTLVNIGIFAAVSLLVVSPWLWRNWQQFGVAKLSSIDSVGLYLYQAGSVLAMENGTEFEVEKRKLLDDLEREGINYKSLKYARILNKKALDIIISHPKSFLKINSLVAWQFFTHDGYYDLAWHLGFYRDGSGPPITILDLKNSILKLPKVLLADPFFFLFIAGRVLWVIIFFAAMFGAILSLRDRANRSRDIFMLLMIAYVLLASLSIGYSINARFRLPISVFYIAYTMFAFSHFFKTDAKNAKTDANNTNKFLISHHSH